MNYHYFLHKRLGFVRRFYDAACETFHERRRRIEAEEPPFEPGYSEDGEPQFLDEWIDAGDCMDALGQAALSMLSTSLQLYLREWVDELRNRAGVDQLRQLAIGLPEDEKYRAIFKKEGWVKGYCAYFAALGLNCSASPVALSLLEDIARGRNTIQHTDDITSVRARGVRAEAAHTRSSFFADPLELAFMGDGPGRFGFNPRRLEISREKLFAAIDAVEQFCAWLDGQQPFKGC